MPETLAPLSDDEYTVLMLTNEGAMLAPVGRWKAPIESLLRRGFLIAHDAMNIGISDAGRAAFDAHDTAVILEAAKANTAAFDAQASAENAIMAAVGEIARLLPSVAPDRRHLVKNYIVDMLPEIFK